MSPPRIQHPNKIVSVEMIKFFREIFKQNFESGNWHIDPETQMYIREDYPEDPQQKGVKPGIVVGEYGQVNKRNFLGQVNYSPTSRKDLSTVNRSQQVFNGQFSLSAISEARNEAQTLAYLTLISLDHFLGHLVGSRGIHHLNAQSYSRASSFKQSSQHNLWESKIPVEYVISKMYWYSRGDHKAYEEYDLDFSFGGEDKKAGQGVNIESVTDNTSEEYNDPQVTVNRSSQSPIEYEIEIIRDYNYDFTGVEEVLLEDFVISSNTIMDLDLPQQGVLSTVYLEADQDLTLQIYEDGFVEYRSETSDEIYDIPSTVYTEDLEAEFLVDSETQIKTFRIRVLEMGDYQQEVISTFKPRTLNPTFHTPDLNLGVAVEDKSSTYSEQHLDPEVDIEEKINWGSEDFNEPGVEVKKESNQDSEKFLEIKSRVESEISTETEDFNDPDIEVSQETTQGSEEFANPESKVEAKVLGLSEDSNDPAVEVNQETLKSSKEHTQTQVKIIQEVNNRVEEFYRPATIIRQYQSDVEPYEAKLIEESGYKITGVSEALFEDLSVTEGTSIELSMLSSPGVLSTVYMEADSDTVLMIYDGDMLEYMSESDSEIYDIPDIIYDNDLVIEFGSEAEIEILRIRSFDF